jgi:hypothetical protein
VATPPLTRRERRRSHGSRRTKILAFGGAALLVVALATAGVVIATGGNGTAKRALRTTTTTTTLAPTTTTKPPPVAPLTGVVDPSGASLGRPALTVKVENTQPARPQTGIDQADVVYEEVVEGNITRFLTVYNSVIPQTIGPVRSVRAEDPDIVWPLGGIFAFSGGAQINVDAIRAAPVHVVDETAAQGTGAMERNAPGQPPRDAPHNLYGHGPELVALGGQPVPPSPLFQYSVPAAPVAGDPVTSMHVGFLAGYDVTYNWDAASGTWKRFQLGEPHTVVGGAQIAPQNVVVQFTPYTGEAEGVTVGQGDVWIFSGGTVRTGRWLRPDRAQPAKYVDANGAPLLLSPGRTWVELLPVGLGVDVVKAPVPPTTTTVPPPPTTTTRPKSTTTTKKK